MAYQVAGQPAPGPFLHLPSPSCSGPQAPKAGCAAACLFLAAELSGTVGSSGFPTEAASRRAPRAGSSRPPKRAQLAAVP